jgi:hypothetical protein
VARRRRLDPEAQRTLTQRQAELTALTQHPSWPALHAEVDKRREQIERTVLRKALTDEPPTDPIEFAYLQGVVSGMQWVARVPITAEARLERYLREARAREGVTSE